ncbi:MAG: hypothetical protein ACXW4B_00370 [Micavibrio sp.]
MTLSLNSIIKLTFYGTVLLVVMLFVASQVVGILIPGDPSTPQTKIDDNVSRHVIDIRVGINKIYKDQGLKEADLNSIDFSEHATGDSARNIFHAEGGGVIRSSLPFIFTLGNKISGSGSEKSDLIILLKKPDTEYCVYLQQNTKGSSEIPDLTQSPSLIPHPQEPKENEVVEFPSTPFGCVNTPEGLFYYYLLFSR